MKFTTTQFLKYTALFLLMLGFGKGLVAQQLSMFNNNIANPFSINPSQAGVDDSKILFQHRKQWIGVQGAPEKSLLTSEWRLKNSNTAVGFTLSRDQSNVIANTSSYVTVAKHFPLKGKSELSFGASAGVRHNSIDFAQVNVQDQADDLLFRDRQNTTNFDGRFGLTYRVKGLEVQASALQLFGNKAIYDNSFDQKHLEYTFVRHFVASAGYRFNVTDEIGIKPIIQLRGIQGSDFQREGILRLDYKNQFWAAGHYRHKAAAAITLGMNISDAYVIGYSGEVATNQLAGYNGGTHEILFGVKLGNPLKGSGKSKDGELKQLKSQVKTYDERLEYLQEANRKLREEMEAQRKRMTEIKRENPELDYNEIRRIMREEADKVLEEYEAKRPAMAPAGTSSNVGSGNGSNFNMNPEIRPAEQPYYVVISSMKTPKRALKAVRKAKKGYDLESFVVHPAESKYYFVTTGGFSDREEARLEMKRVYRYNTAKEFQGKPWVYEQK